MKAFTTDYLDFGIGKNWSTCLYNGVLVEKDFAKDQHSKVVWIVVEL